MSVFFFFKKKKKWVESGADADDDVGGAKMVDHAPQTEAIAWTQMAMLRAL